MNIKLFLVFSVLVTFYFNNLFSQDFIREYEVQYSYIHALAFNNVDNRFASADSLRDVKIWDPSLEKPLLTLTGHYDEVYYVLYSPNNKYFLSACSDEVKVWDASSYKFVMDVPVRKYIALYLVSFLGTDNAAIFGNFYGEIFSFDLTKRSVMRKYSIANPSIGIIMDSKREKLASIGGDENDDKAYIVNFWNISDGKRISFIPYGRNEVYRLLFSPNGRDLVIASEGHNLAIWDINNRTKKFETKLDDDPVQNVLQ